MIISGNGKTSFNMLNMYAANMVLDVNPSQKLLTKIQEWLKQEKHQTGQGFYVNWKTIQEAFERNEMATLLVNGEPQGFAIWNTDEKKARLNIVEIHPAQRRKQLGRRLLHELTGNFIKSGVVVIDLECEPPESETAWKRLGFVEFGDSFNNSGSKRLYKILIPVLEQGRHGNTHEVLSLWDKEPIYASKAVPIWEWNLVCKEGTKELTAPVIVPCDKDWKIALHKDGKEIFAGKAKYLPGDCTANDFLIIETIP